MGGSSRRGPVTPPTRGCSIPPRTPGSLGINDQGDPNITSLLGDTPGSIGMCDWADMTHRFVPSETPYPNLVCKAPEGSWLAIGFNYKTPLAIETSSPSIALGQAQDTALKITTYFEGGKSMNYQSLNGDFDGQGTSFGIIQWNFGSNTLGPLLKKMLDKDGSAFAACFGVDSDYETLKKAVKEGNRADQLKWARNLTKVPQSKQWKAWRSAFIKLGSNDAFNNIQRELAIASYHPLALAVVKNIRDVASTLFVNVEIRTYCAIYDLCVQQHGIHNVLPEIKKRVKDEKPLTQLALMEIVVTERAHKAKHVWVSDCLSRRMGILMGGPYKSKEHGVTVERINPHLHLLTSSGGEYVYGL